MQNIPTHQEEVLTLMSGETVTMEVHVDLVLAVERMHAMRETILSGASKDPEGEIVETVKFVKGEIGAAGVGAMEDEELARDEKTVPCPECGKAAHRTRKDKPRRAMLMTGRVDYRRAVYECRGCGKLHAPLDGRLGLEGRDRGGMQTPRQGTPRRPGHAMEGHRGDRTHPRPPHLPLQRRLGQALASHGLSRGLTALRPSPFIAGRPYKVVPDFRTCTLVHSPGVLHSAFVFFRVLDSC